MTAATLDPPAAIGPLRIAGVDVLIHTNSTDYATLARTVFAGLHRPPGAPPASRSVTFETISHRDPGPHWSVRRDGLPCEEQLTDEAVLVHQQWELNRLAIESERTSIHAAAVMLAGRAALLAGPSHSGKTTLAGWLVARHGAGFVADEVASIDELRRVLPYTRPLGVRPGGPLESCRSPADISVDDRIVRRFMPDERLVPITALGGAICTEAAALGLLVFPRYDPGSQLSVHRLTEADALERLAALTPGVARHGRPVFECLSGVVAMSPAIELRYGDVRSAAPVVADELSAHGGRS